MRKLICLLFALMFSLTAYAESTTQMHWVVKYSNGDVREGEYTGDIVNGIPHGYGLFTSQSVLGVRWYYIGQWSNGIMHGDGIQIWETGAQNKGTFANGDFIEGSVIQELTLPDIYELPYFLAGESVAIEKLLPGMVFIKTTHGLNYVNIYVDISSFGDKKIAIHDACAYAIDVMTVLRWHPDVHRVTFSFEYPTSYDGRAHKAISLDWRTSDAVLKDFDSLRTLIDTSPIAFMKQMYNYRLSHDFRDCAY